VKIKITGLLLSVLAVMLSVTGCVPVATTTAAGGSSSSSGFLSYLPMIIILVLLFGMFYFLMVRPMRQREKKHDQMVEQLKVGDRILTTGGIYAEIVSINQDSAIIKIESGASMKVTKGSILGLHGTENR
jgi:preprotein translocase subunit YajC